MLEIKNLVVEVEDKRILNGLDLTVKAGEVAAIMGPNGSGKSTLSYVVAGKGDYNILDGEVKLDGEDILALEPYERAARGLFLAFQYPLEIPGVGTMTFLKAALNAQRKAHGDAELSTPDFMRRVRAAADKLKIPQDMLKRPLNVGFSGGEKKRMEILQMALFEPRFCILDETDSGLDIDALKVVADGVNSLRDPKRAFLVITHYQRLLNHIVPDCVHVMANGNIVGSGYMELAL
jgi:Fe-S cluster assembly ATP-binding protein